MKRFKTILGALAIAAVAFFLVPGPEPAQAGLDSYADDYVLQLQTPTICTNGGVYAVTNTVYNRSPLGFKGNGYVLFGFTGDPITTGYTNTLVLEVCTTTNGTFRTFTNAAGTVFSKTATTTSKYEQLKVDINELPQFLRVRMLISCTNGYGSGSAVLIAPK
jgi:hypothetical protein